MMRSLLLFLLLLPLLLAACAPSARITGDARPVEAMPAIPAVEGPVDIRVVYPESGAPRPAADSTFLYGTVGSGAARLMINGQEVEVAPNGAFLAYVRVPDDNVYRLSAQAGRSRDTELLAYAPPPPAAGAPAVRTEPAAETFDPPRVARVTGGKDTLATGSEIVHGAPRPGGDRQWFFPIGARLRVEERRGDQLRVRLGDETLAWVGAEGVELGQPAEPGELVAAAPEIVPAARWVDVRFPVSFAPFMAVPQNRRFELTVYGVEGAGMEVEPGGFIAAMNVEAEGGRTVYTLPLAEPLWGYLAFYEADGTLVVRLRRPPEVEPQEVIDGLKILIDPGHPPLGTRGPHGYTEAEANLAISLRVAELLRGRGAEVVMTRTTMEPLVSATSQAAELWARVDLAVAEDVDLLVSIHNNAFPDGVDPYRHVGTEVYYYQPFSADLARSLVDHIAAVTGLPSKGADARSLALVRPSWMPSALTESLYMMFPQQEVALRDADFLDRLAEAHVDGIEAFLQQRLAE